MKPDFLIPAPKPPEGSTPILESKWIKSGLLQENRKLKLRVAELEEQNMNLSNQLDREIARVEQAATALELVDVLKRVLS